VVDQHAISFCSRSWRRNPLPEVVLSPAVAVVSALGGRVIAIQRLATPAELATMHSRLRPRTRRENSAGFQVERVLDSGNGSSPGRLFAGTTTNDARPRAVKDGPTTGVRAPSDARPKA